MVLAASRHAGSESTKYASRAPRERASIPIAPDPQYRSTTTASSRPPRAWSIEKIASRAISVVGRTVAGNFAFRGRPRATPPTMRTPSAYGEPLGLKEVGRFLFVHEETELIDEFVQTVEVGVGGDELVGHRTGEEQYLAVT